MLGRFARLRVPSSRLNRAPAIFSGMVASQFASKGFIAGRTKQVDSSLAEVDAYLAVVGTKEHPLVNELRDATAASVGDMARLLVDRGCGQFLAWQLRSLKATRVLEVGTFTGATALSFATIVAENAGLSPHPLTSEASPAQEPHASGLQDEVIAAVPTADDAVNVPGPLRHPIITDPSLLPSRGPLVATLELDPSQLKAVGLPIWARAGAPSAALPLWCVEGAATESMQTLSATDCVGSFDLVFIDADKGRYPEYYELALALTRKGGVIALDNVLRRGNVVREWRRSQTAEAVAVEATAQEGVAPVEAVAEDEMLTSARILDRLNFKVSQDTRVQHCLLPVGDGLLLATKL